jgi:hypothetical protein
MTIKQHSQEWYTAKQKYIGGSEIFALCLNYCKKELEQIGIKDETSFKTALEVYLEKKFDVKPDPINPVYSAFGLGVEEYIINRINQENKNFVATGSKDFIINSDIHKLVACSPDGFVEAKEDFVDYDKKSIEAGKGLLEVKTIYYFAESHSKWSYLFQCNYNCMVLDLPYFILPQLKVKNSEHDKDFFKGKTIGKIETLEILKDNFQSYEMAKQDLYKHLDQYYDLEIYIHKANKTIQNICKLALKRFQEAIDKVILPNLSNNKEKLMREKKMLAKMQPDKYGEINADNELNDLLNERGIINNEFAKLKTEFEQLNCKIIKKMDKAICAKGFNYIAKFDKRHSLRVSQNKDSDVTQQMIDDLQSGKEFINYMVA